MKLTIFSPSSETYRLNLDLMMKLFITHSHPFIGSSESGLSGNETEFT